LDDASKLGPAFSFYEKEVGEYVFSNLPSPFTFDIDNLDFPSSSFSYFIHSTYCFTAYCLDKEVYPFKNIDSGLPEMHIYIDC